MIQMRYELFLALLGFGVLAAAIVPPVMRRLGVGLPLSLPMACLIGGMGAGWVFAIPRIDVIANGPLVQRITEMAVIVSLTGGGLKLDRPVGLASWGTAWRLLAITMPLCIGAMTLGAMGLAGLPLAAALLLGAALAPTDPVLASSVQVGPPGEESEAEARFALTAEAGLNDGLAFPFVHLALAAAAALAGAQGAAGDAGRFSDPVIWGWVATDVAWKIAAGVAVGLLVGRLLGWLVFRVAPRRGVADAFLAIGITLFAYGVTEIVHGYGFIAVFVAALAFRRSERHADIHTELHHFVEQIEYLLLIGVIFVTGIVIAQGLLGTLTWGQILLAVLFLLVIRPVAGWVALTGSPLSRQERFAVSMLGIRGVGSFYYLAYGLAHAPFSVEAGGAMWGIAGLIVAMSVVLHGITAPRIMDRLGRVERPGRRGPPAGQK